MECDKDFEREPERPLMLSRLKMSVSVRSGVSGARWASRDHILVATDFGELMTYKINVTNNNLESHTFEMMGTKREHDDYVTCLEAKYNANVALTGSEDSS